MTYEGATIETCPGCGGEWLDAGELGTIVDCWETKFSEDELGKLASLHQAQFTLAMEERSALVCPVCDDSPMERFNYAATSGVCLDKCSRCGGIWLDKGELEKVQILSEGWSKELAGDMKRFGNLHEKVSRELEAKVDEAASVSQLGFINSLLKRLI